MKTIDRHLATSFVVFLTSVASITDGYWIDTAIDQHVCLGKDAEFTWTYDETVDSLMGISIYKKGVPPQTFLTKSGESAAVIDNDRVTFLPNAGMILANVSEEDQGDYQCQVNFNNDTLNLDETVTLYTYDCPESVHYTQPELGVYFNGSRLPMKEKKCHLRKDEPVEIEVRVLIPRADPPVRVNVTIHPPELEACVTTVAATTAVDVTLAPTIITSGNSSEANSNNTYLLVTNETNTEDRYRRELAKNETSVVGATTSAPTLAPTTEDPCAVPLVPITTSCEGITEENSECVVTNLLERNGTYRVEIVMDYDAGHPMFHPVKQTILVQFNGRYPREPMSLAFMLLIVATVLLALFLFIMLFLLFAWCIHWCQTSTCCTCRGRKRSRDKQDQELLSQDDALEPECERCEEAMPLSSQPPTDVVRGKNSSKTSLKSSRGSLIEPKTPDRDLEDGRKPPSRRSSGGRRTPIPSPYDKERRRKKYWALRNSWMAANILQQPVKTADQEPPTPDSMDGSIPV